MSVDALRAFYRTVRLDDAFNRLFEMEDAHAFAGSVVALGKEKGFEFDEKDVLAALNDPAFFLREAMGDDELTDAELAATAGGMTLAENIQQTGVPPTIAATGVSSGGAGVQELFNQIGEKLDPTGGGGGSAGSSRSTGSSHGTSSKP